MRDRNSWSHVLSSSLGGLILVAATGLLATDCTSPDRNFVPTSGAGSAGVGGGGGNTSSGGTAGVGGATTKTCKDHPDCDDRNACNGAEACTSGVCTNGSNLPKGTACSVPGQSGTFFCGEGNCESSRCGDGVVDPASKETCDDENDIANDGCKNDCTFTCTTAEDCDNEDVCDGAETCDAKHTCQPGAAVANGTACGKDVIGNDLACRSGKCVLAGCGDSVKKGVEECDDGNTVDGDGCDTDCTLTCKLDADCDDGSVCSGIEKCDLTDPLKPICKPGTSLDCKASDECHQASCDAKTGCLEVLIDADVDGHAPKKAACGDDCNDDDETIYTGAQEICGDGKDNNCDEKTDDTKTTYYKDCDGDSFAIAGAPTLTEQCGKPPANPSGCPLGTAGEWTTRIPADDTTKDCNDANAAVRPNQTVYGNAIPGATSLKYDWNCSKVEEKQYTATSVSTTGYCSTQPQICCISKDIEASAGSSAFDGVETKAAPLPGRVLCYGASGWTGTVAPACGGIASSSVCGYDVLAAKCVRTNTTKDQQQCR